MNSTCNNLFLYQYPPTLPEPKYTFFFFFFFFSAARFPVWITHTQKEVHTTRLA
ncbi:hypothetical protein COCMIDRAFT_82764 [Bipolaris oryzae ATCC 44560]|uniref:Uncharacterized protein n=1 Tax=Bipolaris oryzae ATCC 44560 TaxID=930090 RepID=W6ZRV6_COCMI|nr:uncharacterized protein COCMIDRAFT_82764 [Bipolaris oryzae ATCC 44560]EUC50224.1 hypothetical protein COCMIDRAFT_82764 [Bipolaris oryzae ATCC 44560]